jgi:tetratricopeptide (TPR) repeat protein
VTREALVRSLDAVERASLAEARRVLHGLRATCTASWLDAELRARLRALAARCDERIPELAPQPLGIGESWLLLVAADHQGTVARMRVARAASHNLLDEAAIGAALDGLAAAATRANRRLASERLSGRFELVDLGSPKRVDGASLGLATCVAALSHLLGQAPRFEVAGTARVDRITGGLHPVGHVEAKLAALRRQWPEVDTVVLAADQSEPRDFPGLTLLRVGSIDEAVELFGLSLAALPTPHVEDLRIRVAAFASADTQPHDLAGWAALSREALEIAGLLKSHEPDLAARAQVWAGLFASHAGDNERASAILDEVEEAAIELEEHRVMAAAIRASARIDRDPDGATTLADASVRRAETLDAPAKKRAIGKAVGTAGRARMHGGRLAEAEPLLRRAVEHHAAHLPAEAPRSTCYLACCLRLMGRAEEAEALARHALAQAELLAPRFASCLQTVPYARLELGRALATLGQLDEAHAVLLQVVDAQTDERAYPRLGAHRSLARVLRSLHRPAEAEDHLRICWDLARDAQATRTPRRLGLVAAAELVADGARSTLVSEKDLDSLWTELFGDASRHDVLATWIY